MVRAQRRVERMTLGLGLVGATVAAIRWGSRPGLAFAVGAGLAWINYRWLKQGVTLIVPPGPSPPPGEAESAAAAIPSEAKPAKAPRIVFAKFFGRYVLLLGALYVILSYSLLPAAAFFAGLFVVVAAVLVELVYELMGHRV